MSSLLDSLFIVRPPEDPGHVDTRGVHHLRIEVARLDQLLHLGDGDARGGGHHRVEVARRLAVHEVAQAVASVGLDQGEVGQEGRLQNVVTIPEAPGLLAVRDHGAEARRREKSGDARAPRADALREGPLGHQLDLKLALEKLLLEQVVLSDVGGDHLADLPRPEQQAEPVVARAGVVAHHREILRPLALQRLDQVFGDAAESEAADHQRGPVGDVQDRLVRVADDLVHGRVLVPGPRRSRSFARPRADAGRPPFAFVRLCRSSMSTPPVARGWMKAMRDPSAPGRPSAPATSSPAPVTRSRAVARSPTSKQTWWIPSPRFSRKRPTLELRPTGSTSSIRLRPPAGMCTPTPPPSAPPVPASSRPRMSRYRTRRSSMLRTATPR